MVAPYQRVILVVIAGIFLTGIANQAIAKQELFEGYKRVIAIDPGHGGDELGAKGADGTTEKAVTMSLARILATELQREYKAVLTRTDDLTMDLDQRTALANHHRADIFISIHTGGSFVHSTSGILVFHYQDFSEDPWKHNQDAPSRILTKDSPTLWDRAQSRHLGKSRILAELVNTRLSSLNSVKESRVQGAPLFVLQGADMPAILIEIGYLTNPSEEKKLRDQRYLTDLAREISRGIDGYFAQEQ